MIKSSHAIAAAVLAGVGLWLLSGVVTVDQPTPPPSGPAGEPERLRVQVKHSVAALHVRHVSLFGRTDVDRTVTIKAETSGRIVRKAVLKGQRVAAGQVVVALDLEDREARLRQAEARLEEARAVHEASRSLSRSGYRSAIEAAASLAALEEARAFLAAIRLEIERTTIRAPFAGTVEGLRVEEGDYVDAHDPIATIVDLDPLVIVAEITERDANLVKPGTIGTVRLVTGHQSTGTVDFVSRTATEATRTFRVDVKVANPDEAIPAGLTAEVRLPLGETMAHFVSPALLTLADDGRVGVKVVDAEGRVEFRPAKIVDASADGVWLGGLPDRITVISAGQEYVTTGRTVQPVPDLPTARADGPT